MHAGSGFHIDALAVFFIIGFLTSFLLRILTHALIRWFRHVAFMRKLSGGSLIVDAEADAWLKKINDPTYVPQWRWTYGEKWKKKYSAPSEGKRSLARKIGYVNVVLVLAIVLAFVFPYVGNLFGGVRVYIETETRLAVYFSNNLTFEGQNKYTGWSFLLNGTEYGGPYGGGSVGLIMTIERSDDAVATRDVILNLTSYMLNVPTPENESREVPYVLGVTYYIQNMTTNAVDTTIIVGDGNETFFGVPIRLPQDIALNFLVVIELRAFTSDERTNYVSFTATGSDVGSAVTIYGGYPYRFWYDA